MAHEPMTEADEAPTLYRIFSVVSGSVTVFSNESPTLSSFSLLVQPSNVPVTKTSDALCDLQVRKTRQLRISWFRSREATARAPTSLDYRDGENASGFPNIPIGGFLPNIAARKRTKRSGRFPS